MLNLPESVLKFTQIVKKPQKLPKTEDFATVLKYFFKILPFFKHWLNSIKICQSGFKIFPNTKQIANGFIFCQIGDISPNLVTLLEQLQGGPLIIPSPLLHVLQYQCDQ